jgi:hypothetical protein
MSGRLLRPRPPEGTGWLVACLLGFRLSGRNVTVLGLALAETARLGWVGSDCAASQDGGSDAIPAHVRYLPCLPACLACSSSILATRRGSDGYSGHAWLRGHHHVAVPIANRPTTTPAMFRECGVVAPLPASPSRLPPAHHDPIDVPAVQQWQSD